ncbi:hypothetical protein H6F67_13485 [Microcoleus sp. FACHB-1515]|nr:hypothetical protein [Microcoleus sp. FACHB-1515]
MVNTLTTTFVLPQAIAEGLMNGSYERVGGVVRDAVTKQVVVWLREVGKNGCATGSNGGWLIDLAKALQSLPVNPAVGVANFAVSAVNTGVSVHGFSKVNGRLDGIEQQLSAIENTMQNMQGVLQVTSAASILNLGVSVVGFTVILQRLGELEERLQKSQELLSKIDRKIDLSFYAEFRAALDLAMNAFTMSKPENRRSSALSAINRFLKAEHIYLGLVQQELEQKSPIIDEYLLTLALAYIAEARCYLELEEFDIVPQRLQTGAEKIRACLQKYVQMLLTSNPAAYLHPDFKEKIDLKRLTKVYQWLDPAMNENAVFELQRDNLFNLMDEQNARRGYKWVESLPAAIITQNEVKGSMFGNREETKQETMKRLPQAMEMMESMIETQQRFEAYQVEVQAIAQLGISFHEWLKLEPAEPQPEGANLMYILPSQPLEFA